ncbi:TFIIE alpha subunit-domain-containing protein [Roridomyces roridus]|uniref:TFIIE alpha subunit-domain-containing protein n=1 Tax=Roridomyces roridus TaxID=1738132 RepID=A0AAD7BZT0_9AGAR|nr:TFIIE alpha subunit-domain-containing protein [Roridomyces roridus]
MATKEDRETLRLLVQHVSRAFYEPKYTIIMDQLARHMVLKDDDLAGRMGLQPKELNKVIATLSNDRLVQIYRQNELREGAQRATAKQYYYIDYEHFCNVVKWRIARMRKQIDTKGRNELDNKGYICPQCKTSYTPLDVDKLMDMTLNALICEICRAEVVDNEDAECVMGSKDRMQRFNHQMRFIRAGLQKSEDMTLPAFDVAMWVKAHQPDTEKQDGESAPGAGLKIAGADGVKREDDGPGILIRSDKDEATRRRELDAQAQAKRQQNTLPEWHRVSTVLLPVAAATAPGSSNDDILRGLGVVGMGGSKDRRRFPTAGMGPAEMDCKPVINHEAEYWDRYYAGLETPAVSAPGSSELGVGPDDFGVDDDEEDVKPNIQYIDSLNEYRKRARSQEKEAANKIAKIEETNGFGHYLADAPAPKAEPEPEPVPEEPKDDPIVYVNGTPMPAEHDLMTPEEYTAFFQIMQEQM